MNHSQHGSNRSMAENACPAEAVNQCVKFLVCREGSKIPIKNADIENFITSVIQTPVDKKLVIEKANKVLKSVYGYKLVKLKSKGIQYIVVMNDKLPSTFEVLHSSYTEPNHRKILIGALTHIFMSGGTVKDSDMWNFLDKAKLLDIKDLQGRKILTQTLRKQLYLELNKFGPDEQQRFEFCWGQRAEEEIPKEFILNKMAQAFDKEPNYWREQFKSTQEQENVQ
ncbi:MAGE-like protein 2 [Pararge aegeria]|uniref:MAGE-like protein 2 n=2 Tax=Pararge aegeria TaxID=116150 RepID=S4P8X2_9NEOP|nr:MAGE-like protein 2 [Pararge aegeria]